MDETPVPKKGPWGWVPYHHPSDRGHFCKEVWRRKPKPSQTESFPGSPETPSTPPSVLEREESSEGRVTGKKRAGPDPLLLGEGAVDLRPPPPPPPPVYRSPDSGSEFK